MTTAAQASKQADIIVMLVPDHLQPMVYKEAIEQNLTKGKVLMFAHGFNIHYGQIVPPADVDVTMIAPKCPGHCCASSTTKARALRPRGRGPGRHRQGEGHRPGLCQGHRLLPGRSHRDHLCGRDRDRPLRRAGRPLRRRHALIKTGFETLVDAGYQPEIAYFEVCHELKLIIDLIYQGGLTSCASR